MKKAENSHVAKKEYAGRLKTLFIHSDFSRVVCNYVKDMCCTSNEAFEIQSPFLKVCVNYKLILSIEN